MKHQHPTIPRFRVNSHSMCKIDLIAYFDYCLRIVDIITMQSVVRFSYFNVMWQTKKKSAPKYQI